MLAGGGIFVLFAFLSWLMEWSRVRRSSWPGADDIDVCRQRERGCQNGHQREARKMLYHDLVGL